MAGQGSFLPEGFKRWEDWLATLPGDRVEQYKDRVLRSAGLRTLEYLHDLTPVRSGRLANSFIMGNRENFYEVKVGKGVSHALVGTAVDYSIHVNDGYTQRKGQFVPGSWSGSGFHYDPGAKTGMVLTGKEIPGAHMFEKSLSYLEEDVPKIMEFEMQRLWAELTGR